MGSPIKLCPPKSGIVQSRAKGGIYVGIAGFPRDVAEDDVGALLAQGWSYPDASIELGVFGAITPEKALAELQSLARRLNAITEGI